MADPIPPSVIIISGPNGAGKSTAAPHLLKGELAVETTLASKSFAPWVVRLKESGYLFHLVYLWLPSAQMAIGRVESRVQQQGHHVPDEIVQRRYKRGLANFFQLFIPIATTWKMYYNADASGPRLIAAGGEKLELEVLQPLIWNQIKTEAGHE
jgi:predicted ABC-type ATPase